MKTGTIVLLVVGGLIAAGLIWWAMSGEEGAAGAGGIFGKGGILAGALGEGATAPGGSTVQITHAQKEIAFGAG